MPDLSSRVPPSSHVLLVGVMVLFFSVCTLITLQAKWEWWLIPLAALAVIGSLISQRVSRRQKAAELGGHPR